jgi:hypothetical protein
LDHKDPISRGFLLSLFHNWVNPIPVFAAYISMENALYQKETRMKTKSLLSTLFIVTLALAACAPKASTTTKPTSTSAPQKAVPTATKVPPTKAAANTPTAKPTEIPTKAVTSTPVVLSINTLDVSNQSVKGGDVLISLVTAEKPGWVVVFSDQNGQPGTVLGYAAVPAGTTDNVKVTVDSGKVTSKMIAMLLVDEGTMGKFEYPDPDVPAMEGSNKVMIVFNRTTG